MQDDASSFNNISGNFGAEHRRDLFRKVWPGDEWPMQCYNPSGTTFVSPLFTELSSINPGIKILL